MPLECRAIRGARVTRQRSEVSSILHAMLSHRFTESQWGRPSVLGDSHACAFAQASQQVEALEALLKQTAWGVEASLKQV